jgi:hypothetical protein
VDYVVYGTGYGATLMLLGYAVRTWGPGWRFRPEDEAAYDRREFRSARSSWLRFATGLGAAIATGGAALVIATFILMLVNPGDNIGATAALIVSGLMILGVAAWAFLFFDKFGSWGVTATPEALVRDEPEIATSQPAPAVAAPIAASAPEPVQEDEEPFSDEAADEEPELYDEDSREFEARYAKFELHHPEGDEPAPPADHDDVTVSESDAGEGIEAQPEQDAETPVEDAPSTPEDEPAGDDEIEEIEEYVETLTPDEVTEDIVDDADEESFASDDDEIVVQSVDDEVAEPDAGEEDPLEVIPEAHEELGPLMEPDPAKREAPGGREEALRRLRERQAQRAERPSEDV